MDKTEKKIKLFGLLGRNISYSFSRGYFADKFKNEKIENCDYVNFDIPSISDFPSIINNTPNLKGLNVTIPYKQEVIPFLDELSGNAKKIGAVNTITISKKGKTKGYNTDYYGFKKSLKPLLKKRHQKALILGTGGASKGVAYALEQLNISYTYVSRTPEKEALAYADLNETIFKEYLLVINCSPIGTSPNTDKCPEIPYEYFTEKHIAYDLIYNPAETLFMQKAKEKGAIVKNGLDMLVFQAEKAWQIWNK